MKNTALVLLIFLLSSCGGGSGSGSSASGNPPNDPVTDQTTRELLLNGVYEERVADIETLWVCSLGDATRGVGFVFLDDATGQDLGLIYNRAGENFANFWSVLDSGDVRMRYPELGTIGFFEIPEFSGTGVFSSNEMILFGQSEGPTTCIKEFYNEPVQL